MKIVFIGCRSLDHVGGIESYMLNLCTNLAKNGIEVVLYVGSDSQKIEAINGFILNHKKVSQNKYVNKFLIGLVSTIYALKEHPDADIYHFNANVAGFFSFLPILLGKITVYQGHGFEWKRTKWNPIVRYCNKLLDYFVLFINKNILMCSEEQISYIKKLFPKKTNVVYAPGGVIIPSFDYLSKLKNPLNNISYILFMGRIVKEKRCDLLLSAFQNIQDKINVDLVIAGPIENESIISAYYDNKRIHIIGSVFGDIKNAFIRHASVYVIPSELEGLSISLLEAMSYGCLCIASDIPANKEALNDAGLYFKNGDANELTEVLYDSIKNHQKHDFLKIKVQNRIKKYDWNILSKNLMQYYNSISKGK